MSLLGGGDADHSDVLFDATVTAAVRLKPGQAREVVWEVTDALASWRDSAEHH